MRNHARGWLYRPAELLRGYPGHSPKRRTVYISNVVYKAVWAVASAPLRDAMILAYLTAQRPADALKMTEHDVIEGHLIVSQEKTKKPRASRSSVSWSIC